MKLIKLDDPQWNGKKVWIKKQFIDKFRKLYVDLTYNELKITTGDEYGNAPRWWNLSDERIYPIMSRATQISGDQNLLANILKEMGFSLEYSGVSGFATRNRYIITNPNAEKIKVRAPLLICDRLTREQEHALSLNDPQWNEKRYNSLYSSSFYDAEEEYEGEIVDVKKERALIVDAIEKAGKKIQEKEDEKFVEKFLNASQDGGFSATLLVGGNEELQYPIPERFERLTEIRSVNTQDHRQNLTHTYRVVLLDKSKITKGSTIIITIPDNLKGLVIGKGGANIKNICQKLFCFIKIK
ncbi:MAG: KH domain-containing protein [Candidatus Gracilibacteria bacterium]